MRALEIELSLDDLRAVTTFATACAARALPVFESAAPDDRRPRRAVDDGLAHHTAMAAGDAAASAYLHPLADASQVGHILRAPGRPR